MQYGSKINGRLIPIIATLDTLPITKPGEIFELEIQTEGITDETVVIQQLLTLEDTTTDLKILYIDTNRQNNIITMQIQDAGPAGFSLSGFLTTMPSILILMGVVVAAYLLWQLYTQNPIWLWVIAALGGAIAFYLLLGERITQIPQPAKIITEGHTKDKDLRENIKVQSTSLNSERMTIKTTLTDIRDAQNKVREDTERLENEYAKIKKQKKPSDEQKERLKILPDEMRELQRKDREYSATQAAYQKRLEDIAKQQEILGKVG